MKKSLLLLIVTALSSSLLAQLPVELVSFTGYQEENTIQLAWITASESNNLGFEVLTSTNGIVFDSIGFVWGNGTTDKLHQYKFVDTNPVPGINYYKLRQIDTDETFIFTNSISIDFNKSSKVSVKSNPVLDQLIIDGATTEGVSVFSPSGQEVLSGHLDNGQMDVSGLTPGVYFVSIERVVFKVIKQ